MMKRYNGLRQQLTIYSLVISLLLQGCGKTTNPPICSGKRRADHIGLAGKHTSKKRAKNGKLRFGLISPQKQKGNASSKGSFKWVSVASQDSDQGKLKKGNKKRKGRDKDRVAQRKRKRPEQEKQSKSQKVQSRCVVELSGAAHTPDTTTEKAGSKTQVEYKEPSLELDSPGTPKKQVRTKRQDKLKTINGAEEGNKPLGINSPGTSKKRVKKKSKGASQAEGSQLSLSDLPPELLEEIMAYLSFKEVMVIRQLDHCFYEFITGYNQVGKFGVGEQNKPDRRITIVPWTLKHGTYFNKWTDKLEIMPSFLFYQLMREVNNLPQAYWSYIAETQVKTATFCKNKIGAEEVKMLGEGLQKSKVHKIYLGWNEIDYIGAEAFSKILTRNKTICDIDLNTNKLGRVGAETFTEHLSKAVRIINLSDNNIGNSGAVKVIKNIQDKKVEEINLGKNQITDEGLIGILQDLHNTSVRRLFLRCNQITGERMLEVVAYIRRANLEEFYLGYNKLTNEGAVAIVRGCLGTRMKKLDLSFNRGITDEGVIRIAKHIVGTVLEEIDLRQYKPISIEVQELLKVQCPHIRWIFA